MERRIGLDFGGVIVQNRRSVVGEDTSLAATDPEQLAQGGVYGGVRELVSACDGQVWIISKAGPAMQARTLAWLNAVDFFTKTGMRPAHVRFCLEREAKKGACLAQGITHFVDDRVHVMQILRGVVSHLYLFGKQGEEGQCPAWATYVSDWDTLAKLLLG